MVWVIIGQTPLNLGQRKGDVPSTSAALHYDTIHVPTLPSGHILHHNVASVAVWRSRRNLNDTVGV